MGFESCCEKVKVKMVFYGRRNESIGYCMGAWWLVFMGCVEVYTKPNLVESSFVCAKQWRLS
jgi:hypothetical protein